jgi:hypothetical protein
MGSPVVTESSGVPTEIVDIVCHGFLEQMLYPARDIVAACVAFGRPVLVPPGIRQPDTAV